MEEILNKLLSSELLSEEAKAEISTQWTSAVDAYKNAVKEEVTLAVRSELAEQWTTERDSLVENIMEFVTKQVTEEVTELKGDIERYRDLEAQYAEKIVEEKHAMAEKLSEEMDSLIDKIDAFFEARLTEELAELKEDLDAVRQNEFGRKIFEAFVTEFNTGFADEDSIHSQLAATRSELEGAETTIAELKEANAKMVREAKMEKILAPLNGKKREQMAFVLANVETSRLEEAYNHFIGRVLKEDAPTAPPAETTLTESTAVVTGNEPPVQATQAQPQDKSQDKYSHLRKLAGIA